MVLSATQHSGEVPAAAEHKHSRKRQRAGVGSWGGSWASGGGSWFGCPASPLAAKYVCRPLPPCPSELASASTAGAVPGVFWACAVAGRAAPAASSAASSRLALNDVRMLLDDDVLRVRSGGCRLPNKARNNNMCR